MSESPYVGELITLADPPIEAGEIFTLVGGSIPGPNGPQGPVGPQGEKGDPGGWVTASSIASGVNLDTLLTPGTYFKGSASDTTTALNYPANSWAGWIEVVAQGASVMQRATATSSAANGNNWSNNSWYRSRYASVWGPWRRLDNEAHEAAADPHTQYARKSAVNTFTSPQIVESTGHLIRYVSPAAAEGSRWWTTIIDTSSGGFQIAPTADNGALAAAAERFYFFRDRRLRFGNADIIHGAGMPNGVVSAPVGSRYVDTTATSGAVEWIKSSGSGNTGWQVVYGDTGWRNITSLTPGGGGNLFVRRVGSQITLRFASFSIPAGTGIYYISTTLPAQFRSATHVNGLVNTSNSAAVRHWIWTSGATIAWMGLQGNSGSSSPTRGADLLITGEVSYYADPEWPTTLPGTPA